MVEEAGYLQYKPQTKKGVGREHDKATLYPSFARGNMTMNLLAVMVSKNVMVAQKSQLRAIVKGQSGCTTYAN